MVLIGFGVRYNPGFVLYDYHHTHHFDIYHSSYFIFDISCGISRHGIKFRSDVAEKFGNLCLILQLPADELRLLCTNPM